MRVHAAACTNCAPVQMHFCCAAGPAPCVLAAPGSSPTHQKQSFSLAILNAGFVLFPRTTARSRWGDGASASDDGAGGAEQEDEELRAEGALDAVCRHTEDLGTQMFPSESR